MISKASKLTLILSLSDPKEQTVACFLTYFRKQIVSSLNGKTNYRNIKLPDLSLESALSYNIV